MRRPACLLLVLAALAGCAPEPPLEAGVRDYPTDILLGSERTPAPAVTPPPFVDLGPPLLVPIRRPLPRIESPPSTPAPDPCPEADPIRDHPRLQATTSSDQPPPEATYPYRNRGSWEVGSEKGTFEDSERKVESRSGSGFYEFTMEDSLGMSVTYRVVHGDDPGTGGGSGPGIYIVRISSGAGVGQSFRPVTPVKLVAFPLDANAELDSAGVSAFGDTVMTLRTRVGRFVKRGERTDFDPYARVDACGTVLQAWWVEVTEGRIVGPNRDLAFTGHYDIATQYGALPVREVISISGTHGRDEVKSTRESVISVEPEVPPQ